MKPTPPVNEIRRQLAQLHAALNEGCEQYAMQSLAIRKLEKERAVSVHAINTMLDKVDELNATLHEVGAQPVAIVPDMPELLAAIMRGRALGETAARLESNTMPRAQGGAGLN